MVTRLLLGVSWWWLDGCLVAAKVVSRWLIDDRWLLGGC